MKNTPSFCHFLGALLWIVIVSTSVFAQNSGIQADTDAAAVESVKHLEVELCSLIVKGDWDDYSRQLTDDYVRIIAGQVENKDEVLKAFRASKTKTISMTPEKIDVRIYGDSAVLIIDMRTRDQAADGTAIEHRGKATKVFVRRNGRWYLAQLTGTPTTGQGR